MNTSTSSRGGREFNNRNKGSAIITALILTAATAVITAGLLARATSEVKLASRSLFETTAYDLAEAGLETGLFAFNTSRINPGNGWIQDPANPGTFTKTETDGLNFNQATGTICIRLDNANTVAPTITAAGNIQAHGQPAVFKQLRITGTKRVVWSGGVVAQSGITFNGTNRIDGYDSHAGEYDAVHNCTDRGSVVTRSTSGNGSATVWGYATHDPDHDWLPQHHVTGLTTPAGVTVDPTRVRTDFNVNLSKSTSASRTNRELGDIRNTLTLPRAGDTPDPVTGRYHYHCNSISLHDNDRLRITGACDIVCDGNIETHDSGGIDVGYGMNDDYGNDNEGSGNHNYSNYNRNTNYNNASNTCLNLYTSHDVDLGSSDGMNNCTGHPESMVLWGTTTGNQSHNVHLHTGGHRFKGALYCPNATIQCDDDEVHGSVICNQMTLNGRAKCHYDTNLQNIGSDPNGDVNSTGGSTVKLGSWAELTDKPGTVSNFARDNRAPFTSFF